MTRLISKRWSIKSQSRGQKLKGLIKLTIKVKDIKTWRLMQSICAHTTSVLNARCLISEEWRHAKEMSNRSENSSLRSLFVQSVRQILLVREQVWWIVKHMVRNLLILNVSFVVQLRCGSVGVRHTFVILVTELLALIRLQSVKERVSVIWGLKWRIIHLTVQSLRLAVMRAEVKR